jgi:hypothetical protein
MAPMADVRPGETAVRVFIDRAGRPEENWDSYETLDDFAKANSEGLDKLQDGLLPSIAWIEFFPDHARTAGHAFEAGLGPYEKLPGEPNQRAGGHAGLHPGGDPARACVGAIGLGHTTRRARNQVYQGQPD